MKATTKYICQACGYESLKWLGKCPSCGEWNTLIEEVERPKGRFDAVPVDTSVAARPKRLSEIDYDADERIRTGDRELDRVLGGGIVKGSLVLVGGDPGIGKSTLLLQICHSVATDQPVLYVSGEESASQIKLRADRLKIDSDRLLLLAETNLDNILHHAGEIKPCVMIIDSIQTIFKPDVASAPGSVSQVREATHFLMRLAKENKIAVFIVGHVTKEGNIAGPRVLEHMVDCVLYFEGERQQSYRILRTVKNRFGSTNEIGVFEMKDSGLVPVDNPSAMLLSGRPTNASGSTVVCTLEGTRPVMAEVQALSSPSGFGNPRRMATGMDYNRAVLLVAILEKKLHYSMQNQDVYINVVGGLRMVETATDLAVILAIASNYKNFIIPPDTIILGEVGLTGEVRGVSFVDRRIAEAKKLGFSRCIIPYDNLKAAKEVKGIELVGVRSVKEAIAAIVGE
ncbi:MAG: DNA repair protein RadA [Ruminococcaceae bacterium]|nr:DNA repair protein RadA [Oscillospiraceae bacterium]